MTADRVHKDYRIVVCGKTMCADLIELPTLMLYLVWTGFLNVMPSLIVVVRL